MIKYLGSKRVLVPELQRIARLSGATTALDMFTGTTRVAQAFKEAGIVTGANDLATYAKVLADCYVKTNARQVDFVALREILRDLGDTPGRAGYFTETFCVKSRFFQPQNGARVDAIRERLEREYARDPLYPVLLTSLMEAADRVDSTTGQQMAYLKTWAPRSFNDLELRVPELLDGSGWTWREDANTLAVRLAESLVGLRGIEGVGGITRQLGDGNRGTGRHGAGILGGVAGRAEALPEFDLVYLDPPYNQHRYFTNYHIWETLVRWDAPEAYGVAQKRVDARDPHTRSPYNRRREMPRALADLVATVPCQTLVLSYNNESWVDFEELFTLVAARFEDATALAFDSKRYVGAQIGIYSPTGQRVGRVSHLRNLEYVFVGGSREVVAAVRDDFAEAGTPVHV